MLEHSNQRFETSSMTSSNLLETSRSANNTYLTEEIEFLREKTTRLENENKSIEKFFIKSFLEFS